MRHRTQAEPRKWLTSSLLIAMTLLAACQPSSGLNPELQSLSAEFKAANQASDIEPMLALYHLDGSDERITTRLKSALHYELGLPIEQIEFTPLSGAAEETIEFTHDGISYGPSLPPRYRMRVIYAGTDQFTSLFTIGKSPSGAWRIICAKPTTVHY